MTRWLLPLSCLGILILAGALLQFVGSSAVATATIGTGTAPQTALHLPSGQQLYPLRLSARVGDYHGDANLLLVGNLPAELTMINIGPILSPLDQRGYSLRDGQLLNLSPGEQIDLLVLLQSTGAPLSIQPDLEAQVPSCCRVATEESITGQATIITEPALVLLDGVTAKKLWTIPLRMDLPEKHTPSI